MDAPLCTYHPTVEMVLMERHETMEKTVSSLDANSSSLAEASALLVNSFYHCLPFAFFF